MRSIDIRKLSPSQAWCDKANQALKDVCEDRSKLKNRSSVWCELKEELAELSYDKCWYCESKQERSDDAVDHFRPKGNVKDAAREHPGYWWLAFEMNNYRYACTFCNSRRKNTETGETGGKGDYFPLLDEDNRAYTPSAESAEKHLLLDPCKADDPSLLDFRTNGTPCCKYPDNPIDLRRVNESIKLYHLDHPASVEERRKLAIDIESWIDEAQEAYLEKDDSEHAEQSFRNRFRDLQSKIRPDSEYSVFARRVIAAYRHYRWIDNLLETI